MQEDVLIKILQGDIDQPEVYQFLVNHLERVSQLSLKQLSEIYYGSPRSRYALLIYYLNHDQFSVELNSVLHAAVKYCERNANIMAYMINHPSFRKQEKVLEMLYYVKTLRDDQSVVHAARLFTNDKVLNEKDPFSYVKYAVKEQEKKRQENTVKKMKVKTHMKV